MADHPAPFPPSPREAPDHLRPQTWLLGLIAFGIILYLLVQARFILISLVVAIILFSLTTQAISLIARLRIGKWRVTNWLASVAAVLLISSGLLATSGIVLSQVNTILGTTLSYTEQAQQAIADLFGWMGQDVEAAVLAAVKSVDVSAYLRTAAGQAGNLLSATVLISLFMGFLFAERVWFHTKLVNLMHDEERARKVGRIIASIVRRVNHYLLVKALVSLVTGAMVYAVMLAAGLQFAAAVGVLTFVLNFIPNLGSIIATAVAALVAYIELADPATTGIVFATVGAIQFVNGNIIDPMLMGRALRLSSFGIIISLAFWGGVWGVPGMFLSVPIMVALMIVCSHIPPLRPLAILLSREGLPDTDTETTFSLAGRRPAGDEAATDAPAAGGAGGAGDPPRIARGAGR